ncbi:MAG: SDR family oxidoreductase [Candidatus Nanopelagicales bacterium]
MTAAPTALVTGTSSGFGRGVAERLSSLGWQVLGTVRSDEGDLPFETIRCDVTDDSAVARLGAEVERRWGRLDALVNNAGAALAGPVEELSTDELRWQLDVNVVGPLAVLRACLPALRAAQGVVVQVSSESGITGDGMFSAYNASKFGLEGASEALAQELAPLGVRVVIVEPGAFKTGIADRSRHAADRGAAAVYDEGWAGLDAWAAWHLTASADPAIAVDAIVAAVTRPGAPLRLPVGDGIAEKLRARAAELLAQADAAEEFLASR